MVFKEDSLEVEIVMDMSFPAPRSAAKHHFKLSFACSMAGLRNKVHPTTVRKLLCDFAYMAKG